MIFATGRRCGILVIFSLFLVHIITYLLISKNASENILNMRRTIISSYSNAFHKALTFLRYENSHRVIRRVLIVIGTRPEAIKCAPLISELRSQKYISKFSVTVISTGQHRKILKQSLEAFKQKVDIDLGLMTHNQTLSHLFANIFLGISNQIRLLKPHVIIVQGDTTSALATAIAGAYQNIPIAHVEAGLRSFNLSNPYPEEINRKLIDSLATLLFTPTEFAKEALVREGVCEANVFVTGNTGIDAFYILHKNSNKHSKLPIIKQIHTFKSRPTNTSNNAIILVTMHRRENLPFFEEICHAIKIISKRYENNVMIIFPVHPNPNVRHIILEKLVGLPNVNIVESIPFDIFGRILSLSDIIVTDSGGIQEEAVSIGKPVILTRLTTERPEGVYQGTIRQIGVSASEIVSTVSELLENPVLMSDKVPNNIFGDGTASKKIAALIDEYLEKGLSVPIECTTKTRQDSIAYYVYRNNTENVPSRQSDGLTFSHANRKRFMEEITRTRPRITLNELLKIPSKYNSKNKHHSGFGLTVIIGMYKRRGILGEWIEALINQTHPPKEIWITAFASPIAKELQKEIEEARVIIEKSYNRCMEVCHESNCIKERHDKQDRTCTTTCFQQCGQFPKVLFVNIGDMQLKYFGRFQLALQCHTKYVVVMDDDCIPQPRYFATAMHVINTAEYRGILGTKGTPASENVFYGPLSKSDRIVEADVVGGSWFMETEWVKLMFHDKLYSWDTGEDWHLCANARKYANLRSFVMPIDPQDTSTHSFSEGYLTLSHHGDTTGIVNGTGESRKYIIQKLWTRGDRLMDSYTIRQPRLLIFFENIDDLNMLIVNAKTTLFELGGQIICATSNTKAYQALSRSAKNECHSFHDFMVGRDYNTKPTPIIEAAEVMFGLDMVIQGTQSSAVLVTGSSSTSATFAVVVAATLRNIPVINICVDENIVDLRRTTGITSMSLFTLHALHNRTLPSHETRNLEKYLTMLFQ